MLVALSIRNFVIVDALDLELAPGFTVLTGETGAGKSILIDALLLALGERGDADVLREGSARAEISAEFRVTGSAADWLRERDLEGDCPASLLLRRTIDTDGRSRSFVNGSAVTLTQLRELGEQLVDVHGQHAHQSLGRPAAQLQLLDDHGDLASARRAVAAAFSAWKREERARAQAEAMAATAQAEGDRLRWMVEELEALAPQPGEWDAVAAEHKRLSHAAGLLEGARAAVDVLSESEAAAVSQVSAVSTRLTALASFDERLVPVLELIDSAQIQLDEAVAALNRYLDRSDLDASRLADVDSRLAALHAAARRFRAAPESLVTLLGEAREKLASIEAAGDLDRMRRAEAEARSAYEKLAGALSQQRSLAAKHMSSEVTRAMQELAMDGGRFEVSVSSAEPGASGMDKVEFLVAGHAGVAPRPLAKIASGGELSRIALAISVIAASATPVSTLIFDEVDAGIGGAVADIVGRLLKRLGQMRQVLAVTHLPQVAAHGDQHFVVSKSAGNDGTPVSRMSQLGRTERIDELARMLGGRVITDTTRKHARELLAS
jgi:DNA repair protein RecN (Recombination protein N)